MYMADYISKHVYAISMLIAPMNINISSIEWQNYPQIEEDTRLVKYSAYANKIKAFNCSQINIQHKRVARLICYMEY